MKTTKTTIKTVQLKDYVKEYCKTYGIDLDKIDRSKYDYSGAIEMCGMMWKPIPCDNLYMISDYGLIYNVDTHKYLKPTPGSQRGYYQVKLPYMGKWKSVYVYHLVADAFLPNPENKPQINHIDEIHSNNCLYNLERVTASENINHGTRNERVSKTLKAYWAMILTPAEMENSKFRD